MSLAPQTPQQTVGTVKNGGVSFSGELPASETLSGTPTVTVSPTGPTLSNKAVNTGAVTLDGVSVPAGEAVTFTVTVGGSVAPGSYTITATCATTGGQTLVASCPLEVTAL